MATQTLAVSAMELRGPLRDYLSSDGIEISVLAAANAIEWGFNHTRHNLAAPTSKRGSIGRTFGTDSSTSRFIETSRTGGYVFWLDGEQHASAP
ncbi:hypothetical protein [Paraburkholderia phenoliruptrix]|uniref:hypothetical protein n=1 Tax=Paraburkholderia phenoliruptrix TaxID=252970 RepID=UPI002869BA7F|nr:hypothetical protein [Paraburkholderia phenoliruptrix]WMY11052.1 hypothetical protein P3F88_30805 [Paraburkholderia phenoliruptrix]